MVGVAAADGAASVALLPFERSLGCLALPAISSVTYFTAPSDAASPEQHLRARVGEMVAANPWLAGRLVRSGGCRGVRLDLAVSETAMDPSRFFASVVCPGVLAGAADPTESYPSMVKVASAYLVPTGMACIGKATPLFRCTLLRAAEAHDGAYAMIVSLSHVLGDGATYYELYGMLSAVAAVRALSPVRNMRFEHVKREALGHREDAWLSSLGMTVQIVRSMFLRKGPKIYFRAVSGAWVEREKAEHKRCASEDAARPPFVSTNDLLVSWFFRVVAADHALMAVNFRGKLDLGLTGDDAGNYEAFELFCAPDLASPTLVRRSLPKLRRCAVPPTNVPGFCCSASGRLGIATSWAGLYQPVALEGLEQTMHLPIFDAGNMCQDLILIFYPRPGELAMMLSLRSLKEGALEQEEAVGPRVVGVQRGDEEGEAGKYAGEGAIIHPIKLPWKK